MNCQFMYQRRIQNRVYPKGKWSVPDDDIKKSGNGGRYFKALLKSGDVVKISDEEKLKTPPKENVASAQPQVPAGQ